MTYAVIIRAVPSRAEFVQYLQRHIPHAVICWDQTRDAWDTFVRALQLAGDGAAVHMEEDVIVTTRFAEKLDAAIQSRPGEFIQFFSMRKADRQTGSRYDANYLMNQCFYLPPTYSRRIAEYAATWPRRAQHPTGTDLMVNDWLRSRREKYWVHVPSLVDHRIARSAIDGRRSSRRQSLTFADPAA